MTRLLAIVAAAVVLGGGALFYFSTPNTPMPVSMAEAQTADADLSLVQEMTLGDPDAPVTVIEYASYTCPHCQSFHAGPFKDLKADYIDTGKVHFIYREVYFDRPGLWAGLVARCAGPERFFGIVDEIYRQQADWARQESAAGIAGALRRIGLTAGIEPDTLEACLSDAEKAQAMVAVYEANAAEHGIRSTPSFVVNGRTYQNMSYGDFSALIDEELGS
ncbi:MAG: DsbA family protein [Paracoccaceae bacterium]|nr:DsbA family protein [Paracoccaceae bacterium]